MNSSDQNFTQAKIKRRIQEAEASIAQYLKDLEAADLRSPAGSTPHQARLAQRIELFKAQMAQLQAIEEKVQAAPDKQISMSDPDARSMQHRGG
ncbi:IS5/IS1182 family transposase, partial [Polynucleobacter sp. MG-28-Ekke-A2]|nr:IS5/IS1182 family transposase [Polynucleobacter sp. MG-28-Ekke-A2]